MVKTSISHMKAQFLAVGGGSNYQTLATYMGKQAPGIYPASAPSMMCCRHLGMNSWVRVIIYLSICLSMHLPSIYFSLFQTNKTKSKGHSCSKIVCFKS